MIERRNYTVLISDTRFGHKSKIHLYEVTLVQALRQAELARNSYTDASLVVGLK